MQISDTDSEKTRVDRRNETRADNALQPEYLAMETGDATESKGERVMYTGTRV